MVSMVQSQQDGLLSSIPLPRKLLYYVKSFVFNAAAPLPCPQITCLVNCESGYARNDQGCEICECAGKDNVTVTDW